MDEVGPQPTPGVELIVIPAAAQEVAPTEEPFKPTPEQQDIINRVIKKMLPPPKRWAEAFNVTTSWKVQGQPVILSTSQKWWPNHSPPNNTP